MSRKPRDEQSLLTWAKARALQWTGGQGGVPDIGITQAMADSFDLSVTAADGAFTTMQSAKQLAENRVTEKDAKLQEMLDQLEFLIPTIDAYAKATGDQGVYTRAGIDAPKAPTTRGAPPVPSDLSADLTNGGDVVVGFACTTGGGAFFEIQRRLTTLDGMVQAWQPLTTTTIKTHTDTAVPSGYRSVDYRVRAVRTNGKASEFSESSTANFGSTSAPPAAAPESGAREQDGGVPSAA